MSARRRGSGSRRVRLNSDAIVVLVGLVVLAIGMVVSREGEVPGWERSTFEAINGAPEWLYGPAWPFQQLGALFVGPAVALVALVARRYRLAVAALAATLLKLGLERVVKLLVDRRRPALSIGEDAILRGDVNSAGKSFVSGHAVLVAALATLVAPYLPRRWRPVAWVLVGLVLLARVYVGAHNPLDVVAGAGLGAAIGASLNLAIGVPDESPTIPASVG